MNDIDDIIADVEERENATSNARHGQQENSLDYILGEQESSDATDGRVLVGNVEHFFSKISVAAIRLVGDLKLGDLIEIESEPDKLKLQVSSMQINKEDVEVAHSGDDVGIKIDGQVSPGSKVYLVSG
jgi:translation elongation factor EF-1alpha